MRHKVYGKHLSRSKNQRTALFKSLVQSLILSENIQTTESKAKAVKGLVDKIITQAKTPTTRRLVSQFLVKKEVQEKLIKEIVPRVQTKNSGYTSVVKLGRRLGDGAMMVQMSLILESPVKEVKTQEAKVKSASQKETAEETVEEVKEVKPKAVKTEKKDK